MNGRSHDPAIGTAAARHEAAAAGLLPDWTFVADAVPRWRRRQVVEALLRRGIRAPRFVPLRRAVAQAQWVLFFIYAPDDRLSPAHRLALTRLRDMGLAVCAVVSCSNPDRVPAEVLDLSLATYWKALPGYDFSAYTLGLAELARCSAGCTVMVLNDSVLGPLQDVRPALAAAPWDLTGFTATGRPENHVQSYAFVLRQLTAQRVRDLRRVLFPWIACGARDDVIACQETRLARVAARSMTVGAYWYSREGDPTQTAPFELMAAGHPFFKRSLTETRSPFPDKERARVFIDSQLNS